MKVLLDTHALIWWTVEPGHLSAKAGDALEAADEVGVAAVTWWELAWLVRHGRVTPHVPVATWFADLAREIRTLPLTPAIALAAAALPETFPADPADRLIVATAVEHGWSLVTKDRRLQAFDPGAAFVIW